MRIERIASFLSIGAAIAALAVAPVVAAGDEDIPRTASGRPDLTGRYNIANLTPFERDPRFGDKLFMTDEEADAVGWWEGDTLVVETTNFLSVPNVPREGLRVVERFSRQSADEIIYEFTVHDPDYTAP